MATLEKIRSKSVLLIVIIGLALLAFIVGDALTNSRNLFGNASVVAKVGKEKIEIHEYQQKHEELMRQLEQARQQSPEQYENFDTQLLAQMAMEALVTEKLIDKGVENSGIRSSSSQLRYYMIENPANQNINILLQQMIANNIPVSTPAQAYDIIFNPKKNGFTEADMKPYQQAWLALEEETKKIVKRNSYNNLVYGTIKANDLDKKALYNDYVQTSQVALAFKPYGQLDEKKYPVSDKELKEAYQKDKNNFKVNELTKEIGFIAVSINPSAADRKTSKELAQKAFAMMNDSNANTSKDLRKEGILPDRKQSRLQDIKSSAVKDYVASAPKDSVKIVQDDLTGFTIVKMGKKTSVVDSVQINLIQVLGTQLPQKVLASVNNGLPMDSLLSVYKGDSVVGQPKLWIPLYTDKGPTNALEQNMLDSLRNAGGKFIILQGSDQGSIIAQLVEETSPVDMYEYEEINYTIKPSLATINNEKSKMEKFLLANNTAKKVRANAAKSGYTVQDYMLTPSSPAVPRMAGMSQYYPDSRKVVRWVIIDGKPGDVSHIMESSDPVNPAIYVAVVDDQYDDYIPLTNKEVKQLFTDEVRRSKAGDDMVKQYQKSTSSVANAAKAMDVNVQEVPHFRFGRNYQVNDNKVMGAIAGTKPGNNVYILKGDDGVYVYQVKKNETEKFPYTDQTYEQQYFQMLNPDFTKMLIGNKKVDNRIYKFEAGE